MAKYIIEYDREVCIGVGACAGAAPDVWTMESEDKKADIKANLTPKIEGKMQYLEFDEDQLQVQLEAAQVCPVFAIKIKNLETGEYVYPQD